LRILVTGSTGFIGRHVVRDLAACGHNVLSSSRATIGPPDASQHLAHDFGSDDPFPEVGALDAIVHLAGNGDAQASWGQTGLVALTNAQGTLEALRVASRTHAIFVLASSQRVYRPQAEPLSETVAPLPPDPYGYTKLAAELYVEMAGRLFEVPGAVLRLFSVYGPGQEVKSGISGVVAILGQRAIENKPLIVMSHQAKDFIDVADVSAAIQLALAKPSRPARAYNIATGVPTSILDLARLIKSATASSSEIVEDYREGDPGPLVADISRARQELGFMPRIPLKEGLSRYVDWLVTARAHSA
jgi:UDP-glucose 4-epimerase